MPRLTSTLTPDAFVALLLDNAKLREAVTVTRTNAASVVFRTTDPHAASALRILAERRGARATIITNTAPSESGFVVTVNNLTSTAY